MQVSSGVGNATVLTFAEPPSQWMVCAPNEMGMNPIVGKMRFVALGALVALGACGRDTTTKPKQEVAMSAQGTGQPPKPPTTPPAPASAAAAPAVDRELDVKDSNASAKVRVKLPASWSAGDLQIVLRDEFNEAIAGVQFTVTCDQACGDAEIAQIPKLVDQTFETRARPNLNTGDPALDAVRLNVAVVEQGDVPSGKFRVARVTKPAGLDGPYREQLYAVCVRAKPGAKVVAAQAWAPIDRERDLGAIIVTACKTFEIL